MRTTLFLYEHRGVQSWGPWAPIAEWVGQGHPRRIKVCPSSAPGGRPERVPCFRVLPIPLPDWLSAEEWLREYRAWARTWAYGVQREWPEAWQRRLHGLPGPLLLACVELLLTKAFRSAFRKSLLDQLVSHLERADRPWPQPFSARQLALLLRADHSLAAARLEEALARAFPQRPPGPERSAA
jgi:hypothetical protein